MAESSPASSLPSPVIAIVSWLVPGGGYWLLGHRARALTVGITIALLFVGGLLIGGVRSLEVPGYSSRGKPILVSGRHVGDDLPGGDWVLTSHPLDEIRSKPWSIAQVMAGPLYFIGDWCSIRAAEPAADGSPNGARSHSRTNEIGVLYTAVAGMLNLLAIIDAAHRAGHTEAP